MPVGPNYNLISPLSSNVTNAIVTVTQTLNVASTATVQSLIVTGPASVTGLTSSGDATVIGNLGVASTATIERLVLTGTATGSLADGLFLGALDGTGVRIFRQASNQCYIVPSNFGANGGAMDVVTGTFMAFGSSNGTQFGQLNGANGMYCNSNTTALTAGTTTQGIYISLNSATVSAGSFGVASSIACGGSFNFGSWALTAQTAATTTLTSTSTEVQTNTGAGGATAFVLPNAPALGTQFMFCKPVNQAMTVGAAGSDLIKGAGIAGTNFTVLTMGAQFSTVYLIYTQSLLWQIVNFVGAPTLN